MVTGTAWALEAVGGHDRPEADRGRVRVTRWTPRSDDAWGRLGEGTERVNLAQLPQWFTAIEQAYGHAPVYLQAEDAAGRRAVLPSFLVRHRLFGSVVASMPFLDAGGPCGASDELARVLVEALVAEAARLGAARVELRCTRPMDTSAPVMTDKVNLVLALPPAADALWRRLDGKVRNQVRKAERSGLAVEFGGAEKLDDFYRVFAVNMRDLGSPVHSTGFFAAVLEAFGPRARVGLVRKGAAPIGGLIALTFQDTVAVPWASSLREYRMLCPNMLLYWEAIRTACADGLRRFEFGRSSRDSGTYRFKRQWGGLEEPLFWYSVPIASRRGGGLGRLVGRESRLVRAWQRLPVALARRLGPRIRRYLIQ
jgi:FemAB-related protein (PEP-CTERM system-associated)